MKHHMKWIKRTAAVLSAVFSIVLLCIFPAAELSAPGQGTLSGAKQILPSAPVRIEPVLEHPDFSSQLKAFRAKNRDGRAWLYLPGTDICDEVVQGRDNDYYLRRSSMRYYYTEHGCYFADYRNHLNKGDLPDRNTIIYGHNINDDGTKFAQLMNYENWSFFAEHPYIYLQTQDQLRVFRVVAAYYTLTDFYYIVLGNSDRQWANVLEESQKRSEHLTDLDLPTDGRYITLSTCCYKYRYPWGSRRRDQRFVILGMEIDPENPPPYTLPHHNPSVKKPTD